MLEKLTVSQNVNAKDMRCLRCNSHYPIGDFFEGCPACQAAGMPASLTIEYDGFPTTPWKPQDWLIYPQAPLLGEGTTPLVDLPPLARELGIASLAAKYEGANPTGSHKDRMSALFIRRAKLAGAETVAIASSGNAGVSLAAYAALAGLKCVVVTTPKITTSWRRALEMHGAEIIATAEVDDRWRLVARKVRAGQWYPATNYLMPAVGSNPFGIDGYRAIAFELFLQWGNRPATDILVPTSRGDILWGIARGFRDLQAAGYLAQAPRVHAVEPFPRIARVMNGVDYRTSFGGSSRMTSLGGSTVAYQALDALQATGGCAVAVSETAALRDQRRLASVGLYLELSGAVGLTGLRALVERKIIQSDAHAVMIATSHGYKEDGQFNSPLKITSI